MNIIRTIIFSLIIYMGVSFAGGDAYAHMTAEHAHKENVQIASEQAHHGDCQHHHSRHVSKCCITCGVSIAAFPEAPVSPVSESREERLKHQNIDQTVVSLMLQAQYRPPKILS